MENKVDTEDKHFRSGEQTDPAFVVDFVTFNQQDSEVQQLSLSNQVKSAELYAYIENGPREQKGPATKGR